MALKKKTKALEAIPVPAAGLFSDDGREEAGDLLRSLPEGTAELPWPEFAWKAVTYNTATKQTSGAVGFLALCVTVASVSFLPWNLVLGVGVIAALAGGIGAVSLAKRQAVRPVILVRRNEHGGAYIDFEEWWRDDEADFPDLWRWPYQGGRILFLDALGEGNVQPVNPWAYPMPAGKGAISPQDVSQAAFEAQALRETLKVEGGMSELVKTGFMLLFSGGCMLAVYLAGQQIVKILGFGR